MVVPVRVALVEESIQTTVTSGTGLPLGVVTWTVNVFAGFVADSPVPSAASARGDALRTKAKTDTRATVTFKAIMLGN